MTAEFLYIFHQGSFFEFWKFKFLIKNSSFIKSKRLNGAMEYNRGKLPSEPWLQNLWTVSSTGTVASMGHCVNKSLVTCFCSAKYLRDPISNVPHILYQNHNQNSKVIQEFKSQIHGFHEEKNNLYLNLFFQSRVVPINVTYFTN